MNHGKFSASVASLLAALALSGACSLPVAAAPVGIADWPLSSGTSVQVKPNLLFVLDDSGSMSWDFMPDSMGAPTNAKPCSKSYVFNSVYFNPTYNYPLPVDYLGNTYPAPVFPNVSPDGFAGTAAVNISGLSYWRWNLGTSSSLACDTNAANFTQVFINASSADEKANFAIWYSFYRTRQLMMRSSAGLAFKDIGSDFRVGFTTIWERAKIQISDFIPAQKSSFYSTLYGAIASNGTPLLPALSRAGRIFANKQSGWNDPVQFSCQQNFTILSTDGYWNSGSSSNLSGGTVGNQDGSLARPMKDDNNQANTLADVAAYYKNTDLRTSALGNCTGALYAGSSADVCGAGTLFPDQFMTTYTLGLGANGTLGYTADYTTGGSADFNAIKAGTKSWPVAIADNATAIDDLWHAAVNGGGVYYSAKNPETLAYGLKAALVGIAAAVGSGGAPSQSTAQPVAGDNTIVLAKYKSKVWEGDVEAYTINISTGSLSALPTWKAQAQLDALSPASRNIYMASGGGVVPGSSLVPFSVANLSAAISAKYFKADSTNPGGQLSQYPVWSPTQQTTATESALVDYLRGSATFEDEPSNSTTANRLFRDREHRLGDIVSSAPIYVKKPLFRYLDDGYLGFSTDKAARSPTIYVGANDGMLHAFDATTGNELWAYVPTTVIPNLYKLADKTYSNNHKYYVDGDIVVSDVCSKDPPAICGRNDWRTILVAGLGKGGRGYFALDVTNPSSPALLWEINSAKAGFASLGTSFGRALVTKKSSTGQWVVIFASGYDNVIGAATTASGRIYVVNANSGALIKEIVASGGPTDPSQSGIASLAGWVDSGETNNATRYVYGGDLAGNVWRFDIVAETSALLASVGKPITTRPELGEMRAPGVRARVVYVGTGKYLGLSDITDTALQSMYAIRDPLTSGWGNFRSAAGVVKQTLSGSASTRTVTNNAVNWKTSPGWYIDFDLTPKERVTVDPMIVQGSLVFVTNIPSSDYCSNGGSSWVYSLDYTTGGMVLGASEAASFLGNNLAGGLSFARMGSEAGCTTCAYIVGSDGSIKKAKINTNTTAIPSRRTAWRELMD